MPDIYTATWVSHTSLSDFLVCPRAYYLKNVYKDPETGRKMQIMSPPLALGSVVHEVIEGLSILSVEKRFAVPLLEKFEKAWKQISGKRGGFLSADVEEHYKQAGREMIARATRNPGPLEKLAVKIQTDLPRYWLSEEQEIILCGKVDWLEYLPDTDSVHIIDFKTGKSPEKDGSLQLPIYMLLVHNTQKRVVSKMSYWYLRLHDKPEEKALPDMEEAHEQVLQIARKVKTARKLGVFKCSQGDAGCHACRPFESVLRGEAEHVGLNSYNQDVFILRSSKQPGDDDSIIL